VFGGKRLELSKLAQEMVRQVQSRQVSFERRRTEFGEQWGLVGGEQRWQPTSGDSHLRVGREKRERERERREREEDEEQRARTG
jgi:hypothetical protein